MRINPGKIWYWSTKAHQKGFRRSARLLKWLNFLMFRNLLPCEAIICSDLILEHFALATVVHPNVTIGNRVRLFHHVTLATEAVIGSEHRIFVGDNVVIGAGAIVIGRGNCSLTIGNNAVIGAGAVVTRDVARGDVVVGSPARVIRNSMTRLDNSDGDVKEMNGTNSSAAQIGRPLDA